MAQTSLAQKMFERLGIAAAVAPKINLAPGSGPATESVAACKATLVIKFFSEACRFLSSRFWVRFRASFTLISDSARLSAPPLKVGKPPFVAGLKAASVIKAKGLEPAKGLSQNK